MDADSVECDRTRRSILRPYVSFSSVELTGYPLSSCFSQYSVFHASGFTLKI